MLKELFDLYLWHVNLHNSLHSVCLRFCLRLSLSLNGRMAIRQLSKQLPNYHLQFRFKLFCHQITIRPFRFKLKRKRNLRYFENTTIDRSYSMQLIGKIIVTLQYSPSDTFVHLTHYPVNFLGQIVTTMAENSSLHGQPNHPNVSIMIQLPFAKWFCFQQKSLDKIQL